MRCTVCGIQIHAVFGSVRQCAAERTAVSGSAAVCGSVGGSVGLCAKVAVWSSAAMSVSVRAVRTAVCGSAHGSVRAVRAAVCGSALGSRVWQCPW